MAAPPEAVPVASSSATALIRCSQCKTYKRPSDYPIRIINLEPYHVCLSHKWYWTPAKQANNWAPSTTTTLDQVCDDVRQLKDGVPDTPTSWMLDGTEDDLARIVRSIANVGDWTQDSVTVRQKKKASEGQTSPMFAYNLARRGRPKRSVGGGFRLNLYVHVVKGKITFTMKAEDLPKGSLAWSRPDRWKSRKAQNGIAGGEENQQAPNVPAEATPNASAVRAESAQVAMGQAVPPPLEFAPSPLEAALRAAAAVAASEAGLLAPGQGDSSVNASASHQGRTRSAADHEVMPPPALPASRPAKRARRVEPLLVSPMPTFNATSSTTSAFADAPDWTRFLSFPTLTFPEGGDIPIDPFLTTTSAPDSSTTDTNVGAVAAKAPKNRHPPPPKAPLASASSRPLTLAEMLSSSLFEPPDIDLPSRVTVPAGSGTQHLQSNKHQTARPQGVATSAAAASAPSPAAALATQELVSALASLRDGLYARSTGQSPAVVSEAAPTPAAQPDDRNDDEDHESYYEDSIPDTSSEEEDSEDEDDAASQDIGSDMSSFFESSSEEGDEDDGGGESEDGGAGEEDNWLEGFAAQQMGLRRRRRRPDKASNLPDEGPRRSKRGGTGRRELAGDDRTPAEIEVDELDERSTPRNGTSTTSLDMPPTDEVDELDSQAGSGTDA
ncbi:hypothetical protein JCM10908_005453 [Rhodotorula pacifica]|uniref:uncharacterized protein n=1 Tax=Rhodotorula pacifica TaxID=1495444 RepID=UPI00316BF2AA